MNTDDRDERLASILDDAVRDIDVFTRQAPVARRHVIGRASRAVAALAAAAVFVGAVVFASAQFGSDTRPGAGSDGTVVEGTLAADGWQLERPADWFTAPFEGCGTKLTRGLIVSNVEFEFLNPQGEIPSCNERMVFAGFPSDGVAIDIEPQGIRTGVFRFPPSDSPFPVRPSQLRETDGIRGGPQHAMSSVVVGGEPFGILRLWVGADASTEDIEKAYRILGSMRIAGADLWVEEAFDGEGVSIRFSRPQDWTLERFEGMHVFDAPSPLIRLQSPDPVDARSRICGPYVLFGPTRLSPNGAAIVVSDASDSWIPPEVGPRPPVLDAATAVRDRTVRCQTGSFRKLHFAFVVDGRPILVDVVMGSVAADDPSSTVWPILESLDFPGKGSGSSEPAEMTTAVRGFHSEFVSDERDYRVWPTSGRVEAGVVYRFGTGHCGLDWLVDFDGSFWRGVIVDGDPRWVPVDEVPDQDVGTIELLGSDEARYTSSTGEWVLLTRIDGPVVTHLCD